MNEISVEESYDYFLTALSRLDESNLSLPDKELLSIICEELDIEAHSFLHDWTVNRLINAKLIPSSVASKIKILRTEVISLIAQSKRTAEEIRVDQRWIQVRKLANEIKGELIDV